MNVSLVVFLSGSSQLAQSTAVHSKLASLASVQGHHGCRWATEAGLAIDSHFPLTLRRLVTLPIPTSSHFYPCERSMLCYYKDAKCTGAMSPRPFLISFTAQKPSHDATVFSPAFFFGGNRSLQQSLECEPPPPVAAQSKFRHAWLQ